MCGIIGIIGRAEVAPLLVDGLRRLEYRGYDSAGIATISDGQIIRRRAPGKLINLDTSIREHPVPGHIGIGHTRWATHGAPTENNAHPHGDDRVVLVHNGIIENFRELRRELLADGHTFATETDTEAVAHLISSYLAKGASPQEAVQASLQRLEGAFALAILFAGHEDLLIGAKRGSPLAIGYGDGEMYIGSDALALAPLTSRICYLEENDWAEVTASGATIHDASGAPVPREVKLTATSGAMIGKGNYPHFMLKEIYEQPTVMGDTLHALLNPWNHYIRLPNLPFDLTRITRLTIIGCGTSYHAGLVAKYWLEGIAKIPTDVDIASEFRYREATMPQGGLAVFISQSGETADTLAAIAYARKQGQSVLSIVNVAESTMARHSDAVLQTAGGARNRRRLDQGLHHPAHRARLPDDRDRGQARRHRPADRAIVVPGADRGAEPDQRRVAARRAAGRDRQADRRRPRRPLPRPRHRLPHRPGRRAQAQGNQLHPRRGLCRRRR